ncbi:DUF599 family protein [Natronospirillum operosum]|uniref:DUF599 family protein n=1 Tax=Natronospirillum operosum TaxID=2759953 RepID=A0A4Z0W934_9GAMM|nr:DUF599 family protein [Natronospirillum operosum]TGG93519.1 DUF599 family protein [Natronospirillum operosum]
MSYLLDWIALAGFLLCWVSYTQYAKYAARRRHSLSSVMHHFRIDWIRRMLERHNRVADMAAVGNLERNSAFFASSSLFAIAGLVTVLAASEQVVALLADITLLQASSRTLLETKIGVLIAIYVYGFLSFTWSMRQYGFLSVMLGAAPMPGETNVEGAAGSNEAFVTHTAKVMDLAAKQFNYGLRAVYFSLAVLGWMVGPLGLLVFSVAIVLVLNRREFHSATLKQLVKARGL